jgi:hypothetical protein
MAGARDGDDAGLVKPSTESEMMRMVPHKTSAPATKVVAPSMLLLDRHGLEGGELAVVGVL